MNKHTQADDNKQLHEKSFDRLSWEEQDEVAGGGDSRTGSISATSGAAKIDGEGSAGNRNDQLDGTWRTRFEQALAEDRLRTTESASRNSSDASSPDSANTGTHSEGVRREPSRSSGRRRAEEPGVPRNRGPEDRAYSRLPVSSSQKLPSHYDSRDQLPAPFSPSSEYPGAEAEGASFDLRKYLWLLFKHRWLFLGATTLTLCGGLVLTLLTTPIYRAMTTIQISRDVPQVVSSGANDFEQVDNGRDAEFYQTQYELLKSRSLAAKVVDSLNLQDDPAFIGSVAPSPWQKLRRMIFGAPISSESGISSATVTDSQAGAAVTVQQNMGLQPVNGSTIVRVTYDSPSAAVAKKVVDAIADGFIAITLDRRYGAASYARTFLEEHLADLKIKLADSQKALVNYADDQQIVNPADGLNLAQTNLNGVEAELTKATADRLGNELLWKQVQQAGDIGVPQMLESKSIADLRAKRADLAVQYQDKLTLFKPDYPEVRNLKSQIDEVDAQIKGEADMIKQSIEQQYETSLATEQALIKEVDGLKHDITDFRNNNIQYSILQREFDTNQTLYNGLLERYKEIGIAGGVGTNNISIVDRADTPNAPYSPNLKKNLSLSLMLGLLLGAAAAFAREQLDDTFKSPEDLEETLGIPLLGIIPMADTAEEHSTALQEARSHASEAYRSLRTSLQFSTGAGVPKSLLITSSRASEGKSTTAITLAKNYAEVGLKVLLIDADLRRPSLHTLLKGPNDVGLTNCLTSAEIPPEVFQGTATHGLTFIPSGPVPPNPAELLAGPKLLTLLSVAAEQFDLVILDGPPVAGLADAPLLASIAVGTLLVIDGSSTRRNVAKAALKRLHFARAQVVGAVINKINARGAGYGYGYGYGDTSYYGSEKPPSLTKNSDTEAAPKAQ